MSDGLTIRPAVTAVLAHRKASSGCCDAPLAPGPEPETFTCRGCGQPCQRILGEPEEVIARG